MNSTVFLPFNINNTGECKALYMIVKILHKLKCSEFQDIISTATGAAWETQISALHKDVIAQTFSGGGVEELGWSPLNLSHAFSVSLRTCILLVCAQPPLASLLPCFDYEE